MGREQVHEDLILLSMEDITERKMTEGYKNTITELKTTNEQLDRYLHLASHDLQEPLGQIMIFADRLLQEKEIDPEKNTEYLQKIGASAERMSGLVTALLEYSMVSNTKESLEHTDLDEIAERGLIDFELLIQEKVPKCT